MNIEHERFGLLTSINKLEGVSQNNRKAQYRVACWFPKPYSGSLGKGGVTDFVSEEDALNFAREVHKFGLVWC